MQDYETKWKSKKITRNFDETIIMEGMLQPYMIPVKNTIPDDVYGTDDVTKGYLTKLANGDYNTKMTKDDYILKLTTIYNNSTNFVPYCANLLDNYEHLVAFHLAETFSNHSSTDYEVQIIKNNMIVILTILLSTYIVYNLYFLLFFVDNYGKRIQIYEMKLNEIAENSALLHFFFKYTLCPLSLTMVALLHTIPDFVTSYISSRKVCFILLFLFIVFMLYLLNCIMSIEGSSVIIYSIIFIMYGLYQAISDIPLQLMRGGPTILLAIFLLFVIRIIWSITIISITVMINCLYLLMILFFAIPIYGGIKSFHEIHLSVSSQKEMGIFGAIIDFIYYNLFEICLIFGLLLSIVNYSFFMKNSGKLQSMMTIICVLLIALLCGVILVRYSPEIIEFIK